MEDKRLWRRYRNKRRTILVISAALIITLYALKNYSILFRSLSAVGLLVSFYIMDHLFSIDFSERHYVYITIFAIFGLLLSPLYYIYPGYDKVLHLIQPIMLASIIFYMVNKLKMERKWKLVFVFFVVVGSVGLFEIGEYLLDIYFDLNLQGVFVQNLDKLDILLDRNDDSMVDMGLGVLGVTIYSMYRYLFKKKD